MSESVTAGSAWQLQRPIDVAEDADRCLQGQPQVHVAHRGCELAHREQTWRPQQTWFRCVAVEQQCCPTKRVW